MRLRTTAWLAVLAACCLAVGPARSQEQSFAKIVGDVKVGDVKKADTIKVPYLLWGGDVATFLANGDVKTKDGTLFAKQGLKLELTDGNDFVKQVKDYVAGETPFLRGTMSQLGQASEVIGSDPKTKPVVFLQLTWSAGDHLVARPTLKKDLAQLKGKKIALQQGGPHVGMLDECLKTAGLTWKDITPVWTKDVTGKEGPTEQFKKDASIDACFAISPDMQALTGGLDKVGTGAEGTVKGAFVLNSTVWMGKSIADVYACRKDWYDANKATVEKFAAGYLKACEDLIDMKKAKGDKYKEVLGLTQKIYGKEAIPSDDDANGLISDATFVFLEGNVQFFKGKGNPAGFQEKMKAVLDMAAALGNASKKVEFLTADLDYDGMKKSVALKSNLPNIDEVVVPKPKPNPSPTPLEPKTDTIYSFVIYFDQDQDKFEEAKYGKDFDKAVHDASVFNNTVIYIRGHADVTAVLVDFAKAGLEKGLIKRTGSAGNYKYWTADGKTEIDLTNTPKLFELIKSMNFEGATEGDPKGKIKALEDLSNRRAESVKAAVLKYAEDHKLSLDKNQLRFVGVGASEPAVPKPGTQDDQAQNRRVEFRIVKIPLEQVSPNDY
jgi:ABC-type nitrate/sulfonate/bicarbonate transport system substrate-binding protein